eukprot:scaffold662_cov364-Pavlova_lutheri.AAC.62
MDRGGGVVSTGTCLHQLARFSMDGRSLDGTRRCLGSNGSDLPPSLLSASGGKGGEKDWASDRPDPVPLVGMDVVGRVGFSSDPRPWGWVGKDGCTSTTWFLNWNVHLSPIDAGSLGRNPSLPSLGRGRQVGNRGIPPLPMSLGSSSIPPRLFLHLSPPHPHPSPYNPHPTRGSGTGNPRPWSETTTPRAARTRAPDAPTPLPPSEHVVRGGSDPFGIERKRIRRRGDRERRIRRSTRNERYDADDPGGRK